MQRRLVLLLVCAAGACNIQPYHLGSDENGANGDGGLRIDARVRADARTMPQPGDPDAAGNPGGCVPQPERCDNLDNDCDGVTDDGFNFQLDPANCGSCGNACDKAQPNQRGTCAGGVCQYGCFPGFIDCDDTKPGCEYACIKTNGGVEACDGVDNDCDCQVDEGFDTQDDPMNCGTCFHVCTALHATPVCVAGMCKAGACDPGYKDLDPSIPGCEYHCLIVPPKQNDTTCDGVDDDCDGITDEDVTGIGTACDTGQKGICAPGRQRCVNGAKVCIADNAPTLEVCGDSRDNDCDGVVDNGFDKQTDPLHCGPTCKVCSFNHGIAGCDNGKCVLLACEPGWTQPPGHNSCDYECTPSGPEICDGVDNDCDQLTDNADPDIIKPPSFCAQAGLCSTSTLVCGKKPVGCGDQNIAWHCQYPAGVETDSCGNIVAQETLCDDLDNDCDGKTDDPFPLKNVPCDDGGKGICRASGKNLCTTDKHGTECKITSPGQSPTAEVCNGLDDNCDGLTDNGVKDAMVHVVDGGLDFYIYSYEASHPDADSGETGSMTTRACSRPGVIPWSLVSWTQARDACVAANKRLCTEMEWQAACKGMAHTLYPYGATYQPNSCNGNDYDDNCAAPDDDGALPTATAYGCPQKPAESACFSSWGAAGKIYDMSGNLREWTATTTSGTLKRIRGGGYDNVSEALTCEFDFWAQAQNTFFFNLGFRCCANQAD